MNISSPNTDSSTVANTAVGGPRSGRLALIALLAAVAILASACGSGFDINVSFAEEGSGDRFEETMDLDLSGVDVVEVEGIWSVDVEVGAENDASVEIVLDDNFEKYLDIKVDGSVLKIAFDRGNLDPITEPVASVRLPNVVGVVANGAASVAVRGNVSSLTGIEVNGAADLSIDDLDVSSINIALDGASNVSVSGMASSATIDLSGASSASMYGLTLETADVAVDGASEVQITVTERLTGKADGASSVTIDGGATIEASSSGASTIEAR